MLTAAGRAAGDGNRAAQQRTEDAGEVRIARTNVEQKTNSDKAKCYLCLNSIRENISPGH